MQNLALNQQGSKSPYANPLTLGGVKVKSTAPTTTSLLAPIKQAGQAISNAAKQPAPTTSGLISNPITLGNAIRNNNTGTPTQQPTYSPVTSVNKIPTPGLVHPTPTQPVKSQTSPDGTTTTYHAPTVVAPDDPSHKYNTSTGALNPNYKDPNTSTQSQSSNSQQNTQNQNTGGGLDYGTAIQGLYNKSNQNPVSDYMKELEQSSQNNQAITNRAEEIATGAGKTISDIGRKGAMGEAGYRTTGTSPVGEGNAAVLAQTTAAQQQAVAQGAETELQGTQQALTGQGQLQSGLTSAGNLGLTSQGQQLSGLGTAAGMLAPVVQFGQITSPTTGQVIGGDAYGNNPALTNAVDRAIQLVNNGSSVNDATATLSGYGQAGVNAFNQAMLQRSGSGYNPTAQNTQVATNQALGQQSQQQAFAMDTALKQVDKISPSMLKVLNDSGINPTNTELYNKPIGEYIDKIGNPAASKSYNLFKNDLQKYTSQILAAGAGGIPTDVSSAMASIDPSTLSVPQLQTYLATLSFLGKNQLSVLQGQQANAYGNYGGYGGTPTSGGGNVPSTGSGNLYGNSGVNNPARQAVAGATLGIGEDVLKTATGGANILSFILGKLF